MYKKNNYRKNQLVRLRCVSLILRFTYFKKKVNFSSNSNFKTFEFKDLDFKFQLKSLKIKILRRKFQKIKLFLTLIFMSDLDESRITF